MSERLDKLKQLYEMDPNDSFVTYGIAMEMINAGQEAEALDWLDKTLAIDADYFYAYFQKAKVLHQLGKTDDARVAVKEGIERAKSAGDQKALSELNDLAGMLG
jgi:tetratricopeptide (TPR) repeat protein